MSYNADFIFNIPSRFQPADDFVSWLRSEMGLQLEKTNTVGCWGGAHLGLYLDFTPQHELCPDNDLPYDQYLASIGLTGSAGHGDLRVIMLSAVTNIALGIISRLEIEGVVIWDNQQRIAHLGVKGENNWLWDLDRDLQFKSFEDVKPILNHGVQY